MRQWCSVSVMVMVLMMVKFSSAGEWRWRNKVAVVTGASSGIGAMVAASLAENGMKVVGLARREHKIKEMASKINGTIYALRADLTEEDNIIRAFKWVEQHLGGVDVLINNAGVYYPGNFSFGSTKEWRNTLNINILAMAIVTREALKTMRRRGDNGHIININSVSGHRIYENHLSSMYSPSKFAVTGFTDELIVELIHFGSRIKVTSISPGPVKAYANALNYDTSPFILPEDVAEAVIYALATRPGVQVHELTIHATESTPCQAT